MKDYSQAGEQEVILAHTPETGRFLDIGAWDPFKFSNTRALFEKGWSGVIVEPSPGPFARQMAEYINEPRIVLVQAAAVVSTIVGLVDFYVTDDAVSTTDKAWYEKWHSVRGRDGSPTYKGKILVATVSVAELSSLGTFDFVNIDVEGSSADICLELLSLEYPHCICVEHDGRAAELMAAATQHGYREVLDNGCNLIMVRG